MTSEEFFVEKRNALKRLLEVLRDTTSDPKIWNEVKDLLASMETVYTTSPPVVDDYDHMIY